MANNDAPTCPHCGRRLDIIIDPKTGRRETGGCTNPDCPGNTVTPRR